MSKKKLKKRIKKLEEKVAINDYLLQRLVRIVMKEETTND